MSKGVYHIFKKNLISLFTVFYFSLVFFSPLLYASVASATVGVKAQDYLDSTLIGGSNRDGITCVEEDAQGNMIIVGGTNSMDFDLRNPFQSAYGGGNLTESPFTWSNFNFGDAFISKTSKTNSLLWSTYLGGSNWENIYDIDVDSIGQIYVVGVTNSEDFPITENAYQKYYGGGVMDGFLSVFSSEGDLVYSTYFGSTEYDGISNLAIDSQDNIYFVGVTTSPNLTTTNNAFQNTYSGGQDSFFCKFSREFSEINMISYWGGTSNDQIIIIECDSNDNLIFTGLTNSTDYPTQHAYQPEIAGIFDGFVTKISSDLTITFSTYIGGGNYDYLLGLSIDPDNNLVLVGQTLSQNFPIVNANQSVHGGGYVDAFLSVLDANGQNLLYSTYYGGGYRELFFEVDVNAKGEIFATGYGGKNFPSVNSITENEKDILPYGDNLIFLQLSSTYEVEFSSYFGETNQTLGMDISLSDEGIATIVGYTNSFNFEVTSDSGKQSVVGQSDGFIIKFDITEYFNDIAQPNSIGNALIPLYLISFISTVGVILFRQKNDKK